LASVLAERPTMNTPNVNTAVRNGDENAENSKATPETTATSQIVSAAAASSTRRSSGECDASQAPASKSSSADRAGTTLRSVGERHPSKAPTPTLARAASNGCHSGIEPVAASAQRNTPALPRTKQASVESVPRYLPTTYSEREMGLARMGNSVLSSISRCNAVAFSTMATNTP
jgi:hypothetical protein